VGGRDDKERSIQERKKIQPKKERKMETDSDEERMGQALLQRVSLIFLNY